MVTIRKIRDPKCWVIINECKSRIMDKDIIYDIIVGEYKDDIYNHYISVMISKDNYEAIMNNKYEIIMNPNNDVIIRLYNENKEEIPLIKGMPLPDRIKNIEKKLTKRK